MFCVILVIEMGTLNNNFKNLLMLFALGCFFEIAKYVLLLRCFIFHGSRAYVFTLNDYSIGWLLNSDFINWKALGIIKKEFNRLVRCKQIQCKTFASDPYVFYPPTKSI